MIEIPGSYGSREGVFQFIKEADGTDQPSALCSHSAMKPIDHYQQLLRTRGISLQAFGVRDIALEREDAISALEFLREASAPVLGGDVYFQRDSRIELAYANWHCDPNAGEPPGDYLSRSVVAAERYIKRFPERPGVMPLFALVAGDPIG